MVQIKKYQIWIFVGLILGGLILYGIFSFKSSEGEKERTPIIVKWAEPPQKTGKEIEEIKVLARAKAHMDLDRYLGEIGNLQNKLEFSLIDSVSVSEGTATVTVTNIWHNRNYQIRLQDAQALWEIWASINNPNNPDEARIELVDYMRNNVGGSTWAGSIIKVKKY